MDSDDKPNSENHTQWHTILPLYKTLNTGSGKIVFIAARLKPSGLAIM